jgi:hypothetical protein
VSEYCKWFEDNSHCVCPIQLNAPGRRKLGGEIWDSQCFPFFNTIAYRLLGQNITTEDIRKAQKAVCNGRTGI